MYELLNSQDDAVFEPDTNRSPENDIILYLGRAREEGVPRVLYGFVSIFDLVQDTSVEHLLGRETRTWKMRPSGE